MLLELLCRDKAFETGLGTAIWNGRRPVSRGESDK